MWEWMYEGFWDKLEHFCYKLCREESRAEDLTQEVFLKARQNRELLDKIAAYLLKKETITGQEMMAIIEGRDPETVDNYGASKSSQPAFRPSVPETIEAPARHINIVPEPIPMPNYDEKPEDKDPEGTPAEDKPAEHADGDPE